MTKQVKDDGGSTIPLLGYKFAGASTVVYNTSTANTISFPTNVKVITITPTTNCFIEFSSSNANATTSSHYFIGGLPYDVALGGEPADTSLSAIAATANGVLYVSERK